MVAPMDYIFIALGVFFAVLGFLRGFGKQLKFFTSGVFGVVISLLVCYFIFGFVLSLDSVQALLLTLCEKMAASDSAVVQFLLTIRIDVIVFAIVLFLVVQVLRIIIVAIIAKVAETDTTVMKVINKVLGLVLGVVVYLALILLILQITYFVAGGEGSAVYAKLEGSFFGLDKIYLNNPLLVVKDLWKK